MNTTRISTRQLLSWCQTNDKVGQFRLPIKSANKKSVVCHAKVGRICLPPKSSDFIVQVEHVLFSTRKSPNFLECRAVIGQQSVYTTNLWYRIHAVDICTYIKAFASLSSAIFCRHCRDVRSDVCHGSTISSADFLRRLNHAHKSWPTLSIVWLLLYCGKKWTVQQKYQLVTYSTETLAMSVTIQNQQHIQYSTHIHSTESRHQSNTATLAVYQSPILHRQPQHSSCPQHTPVSQLGNQLPHKPK